MYFKNSEKSLDNIFKNEFEKFIPPVFDMLKVEGFFNSGMEEVSKYVIQINELENNPKYIAQLEKLKELQNEMEADITATREKNVLAKRKRDEIRDLFFTESGWLVIRFTEKQVHCQADECIDYIKNILNSLYNRNFVNVTTCIREKQWNYNQCIQLEIL